MLPSRISAANASTIMVSTELVKHQQHPGRAREPAAVAVAPARAGEQVPGQTEQHQGGAGEAEQRADRVGDEVAGGEQGGQDQDPGEGQRPLPVSRRRTSAAAAATTTTAVDTRLSASGRSQRRVSRPRTSWRARASSITPTQPSTSARPGPTPAGRADGQHDQGDPDEGPDRVDHLADDHVDVRREPGGRPVGVERGSTRNTARDDLARDRETTINAAATAKPIPVSSRAAR